MSNSGYVQILHDLLRHPSVVSAPPAYRWVLITIIDHACYAPCQQDDHGILINLLPGQFLCSIRKLAELANVGRKDVEHAIERFSKIEILGQEVRHTKTVFTILWGIKNQDTGTRIGTTVGQVRDIKEEYKNKIQQQPVACVDLNKTKKQALIDEILEKHSVHFDASFLGSIIRRFTIKATALAMDEFEKVKIKTNPRGLLTSIAKTQHEEIKENERKLANK